MIVRHHSYLALVLCALLFGIGSGAAQAKQGAWISPAKTIATVNEGRSPLDVQVGVDENRTAVAAWLVDDPGEPLEYDDDTSTVMVAVRPPNGKFGKPFALTGGGHHLSNLTLVGGTAGTPLVWQRTDDESIYARTRPPGGSFEPAVKLAGGNLIGSEIQAASGRDGTTAVVWVRHRYMQSSFVQASVREPGGQFSQPIDLPDDATRAAYDPVVAVADDGRVTVAWQLWGLGIRVSERPAGGSFGVPSEASSGDRDHYPQVGVGPDGATTVAWMRYSEFGQDLYATTRAPGGEFPLPSRLTAGADPERFDMAIAGDGRATLLWYLNTSEGDPDYGYFDFSYTRMISWMPGAEPLTKRLGRVLGWDEGGGSLAASSDGSTTFVWPNACGRDSTGLMSSTWTADGSLTEPVLIDSDQPHSTSLAAGPDGNAVAVWADFRNEGTLIRTASTVPAYCAKSSMTLGKLTRNRKRGTAALTVHLGSRGKISTLPSPWVKPAITRAKAPGTYRVRVVPRGPARRLLRRTGWAEIKVRIRFDPATVPCQNVTRHKEVVLIRKSHR